MPQYVTFDLGLHCWPMTPFTGFQARMGLTPTVKANTRRYNDACEF